MLILSFIFSRFIPVRSNYKCFLCCVATIAMVCCFSFSTVYAQIYLNRNFTVKDGLINSTVFAIAQDNYGFIWFATENGLSRFDGIEFKNYSLESLGINSFISSVKCIGNNEIYFGTGNDGIFILNQLNGKAKRVNKDNVSQSSEIIFIDSTLISLHEQHNLDFLSLQTGYSHFTDQMIDSDPENKSYSMLKHSNGKVFIGRKHGLYEFKNNKQIKIPGFDLPVFSIFETSNGEMLIGSVDAIYLISKDNHFNLESKLEPGELWIRNIIIDKRDNLWFNPWGSKDIYVRSNSNTINVSEVAGIKNTSITRLFQDRDGNVWAGTIGNGVYFFSNMHINIYPFSLLPNSEIKRILKAPGGLLLGTKEGIVYLDSASESMQYIKNLTIPEYIKEIVQINDVEYVASISDLRADLQKQFPFFNNKTKIRYCQGSCLTKSGDNLLIGNWDNCYQTYALSNYKLISSESELFPGNFNKVRVNSILVDHNGKSWIGSQKGILIKDALGNKRNLETIRDNENIISIVEENPNRIAVVTNSGFVLFENNTEITKIRETKRVFIPQTTSICFMGDDEYLAGTLNGIIYHYRDKEIVLSVNHGILSENVNCIFHIPGWNEVYIGSAEGLMKVNLDWIRNSMDEQIKIDYLEVTQNNQVYTNFYHALNFDYSSDPFTILAKSFVYQSPKSVRYQYRHNSGSWTSAPAGGLYFASLEPGNHIIEISAGKDGKSWGPVSKIVLNIVPPFYMTNWFYIVAFCCFVILVFYIFKGLFQLRKRKHDETLKTKQLLVELQQKALASNLNPHFVFNSLNSIQHFINKSNQQEANNYLVKFSQLMRMQLNMADMSFVSIAEEIGRLENYLSLEQMRFGDRLTWSITVDENIDRHQFKIPNMILQPFVENSIWHGIMPMKEPGEVKINFRIISTKDLEIAICDNGIGVGTVPKPADSTHKSKGVQLIFDRLSLLDPAKKDFITFSSNNPGTCVKILLSPNMYRNLSNEN